jgi:hypothetical protein
MISLTEKLQLKPGQELLVLNAAPAYLERLTTELDGVPIKTQLDAPGEAVLLFVNNLAEASSHAPGAIAAVRSNGLVWIAYPKGGSGIRTDVNRDRLWETLKPTNWHPVRQIAIDEIWSAMRFRPDEGMAK